jgi:hypothetical protein
MVEGTVGKGVGEAVEVTEHVCRTGGVEIDADGAWILADPAAYIESCSGQLSSVAIRGKSWTEHGTRVFAYLVAEQGIRTGRTKDGLVLRI